MDKGKHVIMTSKGERKVRDVGVGNLGKGFRNERREVITNLASKAKVGRGVEGIQKGKEREEKEKRVGLEKGCSGVMKKVLGCVQHLQKHEGQCEELEVVE